MHICIYRTNHTILSYKFACVAITILNKPLISPLSAGVEQTSRLTRALAWEKVELISVELENAVEQHPNFGLLSERLPSFL